MWDEGTSTNGWAVRGRLQPGEEGAGHMGQFYVGMRLD
jgi:hypothetical protein